MANKSTNRNLHMEDELELELGLSTGGGDRSSIRNPCKSTPLKNDGNSLFEQNIVKPKPTLFGFDLDLDSYFRDDSVSDPKKKHGNQTTRWLKAKGKQMKNKKERVRNDGVSGMEDALDLSLSIDPNQNYYIAPACPKQDNPLPSGDIGGGAGCSGKERNANQGLASDHKCISRGGNSINCGIHSTNTRTNQLPSLVDTSHHLPKDSNKAVSPTISLRKDAEPSTILRISSIAISVPKDVEPSIIRRISSTGNSTTGETNRYSNSQIKTHKPPVTPHTPKVTTTDRPLMPRVTTTGDGPTGKTIKGLLCKYSNTEVIIACICHGYQLSPEEFVQHAGSVDVSNPTKRITMICNPASGE